MTVVRLRVLGESVVQVGETLVTPHSPQLFALLLYLGSADSRAVNRAELLELFSGARSGRGRAALGQLLYRLRVLGVPIRSEGACIRLSGGVVTSSLDDFVSCARSERAPARAADLRILPGYEPTISPQFADWLETLRARCMTRVHTVLRGDLRTCLKDCRWDDVVRVGRLLQELEVGDEEVVVAVAEAFLMSGRKYDALDAVDAFLPHCEPDAAPVLRQLRGRIARVQEPRRPLESRLHGRADVLNALARQWLAACEQVPQLAILTGPPGIGKSRLARDFGAYATLHAGSCLTYRCEPADRTQPHSLFKSLVPRLQAMRGSLGADPSLQHHLARLSGAASPASSMEPASLEATRADLQFSIIDLLQAVAAEKTQLLVIDDAQYLDSASLAVVAALFRGQRRIPLMVLCCYRGREGDRLPVISARAQAHRLGALTAAESEAVLVELLPERRDDRAFLASCVTRAGGNPFYLHAIVHSGAQGADPGVVPFDVRAFTAASYEALDVNARLLFESCVLLGRHASLKRLRKIACLDGPPLLAAVRTLEDHGLIAYSDGELRSAHALVEDVARSLIPSGVAAALSERIARCLEEECATHGYAEPLASAAADSWIAAGDVESASQLLRKCARNAAELGEPRLAARTLLKAPQHRLAPRERMILLNDMVDYADVAGMRDLVCASLRDLVDAAQDLPTSADEMRELTFRMIEADLRVGINPASSIVPLLALLRDSTVPPMTRIRAGSRLLIAADMALDTLLANTTMAELLPIMAQLPPDEPLRLRPRLIYETVFGDQGRAITIANTLLLTYPHSDLAQACVGARRNAAAAFVRIGMHNTAQPILREEFRFMSGHRVASEAAYCALMLAESSLAIGKIPEAVSWLGEVDILLGEEPQSSSLQSGYHSAAATLALAQGNIERAAYLCDEALVHYPAVGQRYRAIALATRVRIDCQRHIDVRDGPDYHELVELYGLGQRLGAQDPVVEALWLAHQTQRDERSASMLLEAYLSVNRRELGVPESSLRLTTAGDKSWSAYDEYTATAQK